MSTHEEPDAPCGNVDCVAFVAQTRVPEDEVDAVGLALVGGSQLEHSTGRAAEIGVEDNDWIETYNENGIVVARAAVSNTVPRDTAIMYHASERHVNVPFSSLARERGVSDLRGGNNNAPTRIMMNPATMVGGYANWTYFLNYWGTSPSERDCAVFIRKKPMEKDGRKVIYQEKDLALGA